MLSTTSNTDKYQSGYLTNNFFPNKSGNNKVDYAILSAMPEELEYFLNIFNDCKYKEIILNELSFKIFDYKNARILVAHSGIGTAFAASMLTLIHAHFKPEYVLVSGTAGGIKEGLNLRDVIVAEKAFEAEIQELFSLVKDTPFESCLRHPGNKKYFPAQYSAHPELLDICNSLKNQDIHFDKGTIVSSNAFPAPKELFSKIKAFGPWCIDMETSAFYQVAWLLNMKILAVRGISNFLNADGSDDKVQQSDVKGSSLAAATLLHAILDKSIELNYQSKLQQHLINDEVKALIRMYDLEPHPEGGYFKRIYTSTDTVLPSAGDRYNHETRNAGSSIYYLLNNHDFSAWHSMQSDELWHFYKGTALNIHVIDTEGNLSTYLLGDPTLFTGASFQVCIRAGNYFAAENVDKSEYSLVGCTVSPGFEYKDWKLSDRDLLNELFPKHKEIIERLSRSSDEMLEAKVPAETCRYSL